MVLDGIDVDYIIVFVRMLNCIMDWVGLLLFVVFGDVKGLIWKWNILFDSCVFVMIEFDYVRFEVIVLFGWVD